MPTPDPAPTPGFKQALMNAMTDGGIADPDERAMIAAIAGGETGGVPRTEMSYAHTSNMRLRQLFGGRVPQDDDALTALKADDVQFFNAIYGGRYGNRPGTEDGFTYRGRGPFQLTFRGNYASIGAAINQDLVANPDLVNDLAIGAQTVVAYIHSRYRGGGFQAMLDCVGYNVPDIAARKQQLYAQFSASGEFA